ncbi:jg9493 [Pararge aegeria aegeria]|nr:jg9493 [Pararge aegeria aegeria]
MYLLGVLCLVAFTSALPVLPEPPALPHHGDVIVHDAQRGEHEERKDENEAMPPKYLIISLPEPPILSPFDESILAELININKEHESVVDKDSQKEDPEVNDDKKVITQVVVPSRGALTNIINSLGIPISLPSLSSLLPSLTNIFNRPPRIVYPGYVI